VSDEQYMPDSPEAFKREAVDRVATSGLSAGAVARELGMHGTLARHVGCRRPRRIAINPDIEPRLTMLPRRRAIMWRPRPDGAPLP
jgi:hypothetical protein